MMRICEQCEKSMTGDSGETGVPRAGSAQVSYASEWSLPPAYACAGVVSSVGETLSSLVTNKVAPYGCVLVSLLRLFTLVTTILNPQIDSERVGEREFRDDDQRCSTDWTIDQCPDPVVAHIRLDCRCESSQGCSAAWTPKFLSHPLWGRDRGP